MSTSAQDEWTPALERMLRGLSESAQRLALSELGYRTVTRVKQLMKEQKGFGSLDPYRKLKIKFRYHGHKRLVGSARNVRRRRRGAEITPDGTIEVVNKTPVTGATLALIDMSDLLRSWDVTSLTPKRVDVAPNRRHEMAKASYNDDRGDWTWGDPAADFAFGVYIGHFDREAGFK